jgi:asparagine synthase (glutamine-hydrolysing)
MCGIFGAINLNSFFEAGDYEKFVKLTDLVSYRGPDASGYVCFGTNEGTYGKRDKFDVFLGHRRLSIIDLSERGNQPFTDGSGLWIVYNGEVFNYIELREKLIKKGHLFKTKTDTEVVLKVYQEYGTEGFRHLNGMWAFAILDMNNRRVIISRDRFSIKPLFYTRTKNALFFSSEIKQLLPVVGQKKVNNEVFYKYLQQTLIDYNEQTFYKDIYKVKPKTNLIIDLTNGAHSEEFYWEYEKIEIDKKDIFSQFRELFIDSVKIRLRSDVNVGALLSGGLDSSAISVIADSLSNNSFRTFSIISNEKNVSEEKYIDILSSENNIKNQKLSFTNTDVLSNMDKVLFHQDEPFGGFSVIAQYTIFELIKKHTDIVVVLCGQGGDEILMGYLKYFFFYLQNLIKKNQYIKVLKELLASLFARTIVWQFRVNIAKRYMPSYMHTPSNYIKLKGELENTWECNNIRQRQIADIDKYSVPILAHFEDRNSTAHSLESRLPFLDHRLVNFLLNIDTDLKIKNGWTKYILRKAINELPQKIRWRRDKKGFDVPEDKWLRTDLKDEILNTFKNSTLDKLGIIDQKEFIAYYNQYLNNSKIIYSDDISKVFIAEKWAELNFD